MWNRYPKVDLNKFDGYTLMGWDIQMEHYFSLKSITYDLITLSVGVLYLDQECW
jgi:hypothetical protein